MNHAKHIDVQLRCHVRQRHHTSSCCTAGSHLKCNHRHRSEAGKRSQGLLPSAVIFNSILLVLCCLFVGGIVPGATFGGIQFARGQQGYEQAVAVIAAARDAQDMLMLFKLTDALATLGQSPQEVPTHPSAR